jgi:hypothetical protein
MPLLAAGCGRIHFPESSRSDASDDAGPGPNRAFVTHDIFSADLGGLSGADTACAAAAVAGGLDGNFIAVMSTSATNAIDRLRGSRGWARVDGVPIVDTPDELFDNAGSSPTGELNPLALDEHGNALSPPVIIWTGTNGSGNYDVAYGSCGDWTTTASMQAVMVGAAQRATSTFSYATDHCGSFERLACFEIGRSISVSPVVIGGRIAFLSSPPSAGGGGLGALDALCNSDGVAAGLPGTYLAAAATTSATISSRFTIDARPWRRLDGTLVAEGPAMFTTGPVSFVHQRADGSYVRNGEFSAGALDPQSIGTATSTCSDWTNSSLTVTASLGDGVSIGPDFWNPGEGIDCGAPQPALCLQK